MEDDSDGDEVGDLMDTKDDELISSLPHRPQPSSLAAKSRFSFYGESSRKSVELGVAQTQRSTISVDGVSVSSELMDDSFSQARVFGCKYITT